MSSPVAPDDLTPGEQFAKLVRPYIERQRAKDEEHWRQMNAMADAIRNKIETELKAALSRNKLSGEGNVLWFGVVLTPEEHDWIMKDGHGLYVCGASLRARLGITNPAVKLATLSYSYRHETEDWTHNFKMWIQCC
jgi:hypothetical protein